MPFVISPILSGIVSVTKLKASVKKPFTPPTKSVKKVVTLLYASVSLVGIVSVKNLPKIYKIAKRKKIKLFEIGYVARGKNVVSKSNGKRFTIHDKGWKHFQS